MDCCGEAVIILVEAWKRDSNQGRHMAKEKILVVDDEEEIVELLRYLLHRDGCRTIPVATGEKAIETARAESPDLIVLDLMLPEMDGLEVCRILKNDDRTSHIPIVMLTAKGEEADIVAGLELGADDYVTKPFSPRVLMARLKAVLRRKSKAVVGQSEVIRRDDIVIDPSRREVAVAGKAVAMTRTEFEILRFLAARPGRVFTRYQIIDAIRDSEYAVTDRSVDVQMVALRRKLGSRGKLLETVRGVGYRFKE
jgi:two-component system alkaline phosphatase synthesis response regulator PhoP